MSDTPVVPVTPVAPVRIAVAIDVAMSEVDLIADRLFSAGASAVAERVRHDGSVTLIADLDVEAIDRLNEQATLMLRTLEPDVAWNNGWRDFAKARRCGRIVIRPAWLPADSPVESDGPVESDDTGSPGAAATGAESPDTLDTIELVMEPGVSFGSGTHVTTRLCVEAVDRLVTPGARVLDVGCGTGVLGVAAALLGSGEVVAIDIDPDAVRVTRDLAEVNGVGDRVTASTDRLADVSGKFDLVLANVLIPVIEELGADLVERVSLGGRLVVSGVLVEHRDRTVAALPDLVLDRIEDRGGWLLLEFTRPPVE
ncbi:MAG: 50S ribosomal protein L11 methyltransferase [Microthrixaceae bacterium]